MIRYLFFIVTVIFLLSCSKSLYTGLDAYNPVVQTMPGIKPEMLTSGYWIGRTAEPDKLIMTQEEIAVLNLKTSANHYIIDVHDYDAYKSGDFIAKSMNVLYGAARKGLLYKDDYIAADKLFLSAQELKLQKDRLAAYEPVMYGIIVKRTSQKIIPYEKSLYRIGNGYFDRLQMNSLDIGTPVVILWHSSCKKWLYVRSALTVGWVSTADIALCSRQDVERWESHENFIVITKPKASLYFDDNLTAFAGWAAMGVKLPKVNAQKKPQGVYAVKIPMRGEKGWLYETTGYIDVAQSYEGNVPLTSRNILNIAFDSLNEPYGWGGMDGNQDCSGFIAQLFKVFGIILPRNSYSQAATGSNLYTSGQDISVIEEIFTKNATPGTVLIQFPGHIMLYIGSDVLGPYVIHAMWAYEEEAPDRSVLKIPGRVVVSHLKLSSHTKRGAYINRITNITVFRNDIY